MECKICGYRARDIAGMARHYRKEHPGKMKRRTGKAYPRSKQRKLIGDAEQLIKEIKLLIKQSEF